MGQCTKINWSRIEGRSVDTLFCHGIMSVETYYRYLREYDSMTRRGVKPTVAVGEIRDGAIDYRWTERVELEVNRDCYAFGPCPSFGCPTEYEISDFFSSEDRSDVDARRRMRSEEVRIGIIRFQDQEECLDYIQKQKESYE